MLTFLLDHDVPESIAATLARSGRRVLRLREVLPPDASDDAVLRYANDHGHVVITCNRDDFVSLAKSRPTPASSS